MSNITDADIEAKIASETYAVIGDTETHCTITMQNGFAVSGESMAPTPEAFNAERGQVSAREQAFGKLRRRSSRAVEEPA